MNNIERPTVLLEHVIVEGSDDALIHRTKEILAKSPQGPPLQHYPTQIARSATRAGVTAVDYNRYRKGLTSQCADIVLVAQRDGIPKVLLIKRVQPPFGSCWWIMGGAVFNYRPVQQFLLWKAHTECGLTDLKFPEFVDEQRLADTAYSCGDIHVVGCLGTYRTTAEDLDDPERVCDTVNLCYMGIILGNQKIHHDKSHTDVKWAGEAELSACGHWYPGHVAQRALSVYRKAL